MPTIAGEELNRRLCRDSQRSFHVVAAPPQAAPTQAVTKTPAMATTKSRALAIHRGDTAAPRQQALRKSKSPASPSSSRASKQDDSDDSSGEQSSAPCLSDSNRGEQLATPNAGKQAGCKRKRAPSTRYSENKQLPSWKSDQPTGVLRAPAKPMVQPQLAAPSAEPALKLVHGDNDWMQGRGPQGLITLGWIMPVKGKPSRWVIGPRRFFGSHRGAPWLC